jgi:hypothetical protein
VTMNPRTHPRGSPPDFALPKPNPNPQRMTDALWWLVCMREALEPADTENGGTYANKPGYHNIGSNLPDYGLGNSKTDHSIRRVPDRNGPWWKTKTSAHDWTFKSAQKGNYANIQKYTKRLIAAMQSPTDLRPDDVFAYTLGQTDGDPIVEGYNEYTDSADTSADKTHLWHRHDSFRRNIIGDFPSMWKALTIDMGWTYAEWLKSITPPAKPPTEELPVDGKTFNALFLGALKDPTIRKEVGKAMLEANIGSKAIPQRTVGQGLIDLTSQLRPIFTFAPGHPENVQGGLPLDAPVRALLAMPDELRAALAKLTPSEPPTTIA